MVSRDLTPYMDMYSGYNIYNRIHSGSVDTHMFYQQEAIGPLFSIVRQF